MTIRLDPTRSAGLAALGDFLPNAGRHYAAQRNFDYGLDNRANVSSLSPYIRHRLITEQEVVAAVLRRHRFADAEKFIQEVFWRTYWKGWLEMRPAVWTDYRLSCEQLLGSVNEAPWAKAYSRACSADTEYAFFNEWVSELIEAGYLHNHTRMWFASIWIFGFGIPWELGADFFYRHLLDGDPASNTLSWRWVAGLQTAGKSYFVTADNINRFTGGRIAPGTISLSGGPSAQDVKFYPAQPLRIASSVPTGRAGLLITEEDLMPNSIALDGVSIVAVAGLEAAVDRSTLAVSTPVVDFTQGAVADGLSRVGSQFQATPQMLEAFTAATLIAWAKASNVSIIITPYAPTGPVADRFAEVQPALAAEGIALHQIRRSWDSTAWPYATKGFFTFKEKIPGLIAG